MEKNQDVDEKRLIETWSGFALREVENRGVLLCGNPRSGKSTILKVLQDPCFSVPKNESIFVSPSPPQFSALTVRQPFGREKDLSLMIEETTILHYGENGPNDDATTDSIVLGLQKLMANEVSHLNAAVMCFQVECGLTGSDLYSIVSFWNAFGGRSIRLALCISRADHHRDAWRAEVSHCLTNILRSRSIPIGGEDGMRILFTGCCNTENGSGHEIASQSRKEFIRFLCDAEQRTRIIELPVLEKTLRCSETALKNVLCNFSVFVRCTDFESPEMKMLRDLHAADMRCVSDNHHMLSSLAKEMMTLKNLMQQLEARTDISKDIIESILHPTHS